MTSIMSSSSFEDLEAEFNEMGFSMSLSDFEKSLHSEESAQQLEAIRGEGIGTKTYMSNIRLASELNELKIAPMGHLPTSTEILASTHDNEITPQLRKLGIWGQDGELSSRRTRKVPQYKDDIRRDKNVPVILNGELFDMSGYYDDSDCSEDEKFEDDPSLPLEKRFSTIHEFQQVSVTTQTHSKHLNENAEKSLSSYPESSEAHPSSNDSPDMSSHSTTADDASSSTGSSTSGTTYSAEIQCSSEWHAEPPLLKKGKLYTPRELYGIKNAKHLNPYISGNK